MSCKNNTSNKYMYICQFCFLGAGNQDGSGSPQTKTMKDYEYVSDY